MKDELRAVIYCRVSTQEKVQIDALQIQIREARKTVADNKWLLIDQYIESESATTAEGRREYLRLYSDMSTGKFDIIVIKSEDRLNRNVKDWYLFLDELTKNDKQLYLYLDRSFYKPDNTLLTGIKAILAEQYSRELSKKINNAHRYRQEHGTAALITNATFGYHKEPDKSVSIMEEEAQIVRRMYELTAAGYGSRSVSIMLMNEGIRNRSGNQFTDTTIRRIIRNPLFKGVVVMNKKHFNFEKKKMIQNPESEWIYHKGLVPPVVDEKLWEDANRMMDLNRRGNPSSRRRAEKSDMFVFTGKIVCGCCGSVFYKTSRRSAGDPSVIINEWKCSEYLRNGRVKKSRRDQIRVVQKKSDLGCDNIHLKQEELIQMIEDLAVRYLGNPENNLTDQIMQTLQDVLSQHKNSIHIDFLDRQLEGIRRKKEILLDKLLDGVIVDQDYKDKLEDLNLKEKSVKEQKNQFNRKEIETQETRERLNSIFQKLQAGGNKKIMSVIMLKLIRKIIVYPQKLVLEMDVSDPERIDLSGYQITVPVNEYFSKKETIRREKQRQMLQLLGENPDWTIKKLAEALEEPYAKVRRWIEKYRKTGQVRFVGKGGKGYWEVSLETA